MRPEEIQHRSAALAERVRTQVDSQERLQMMLRTHRRRRSTALAVATAAMLAIIVGVFMLARVEQPPVITVPPPTVPSTVAELQSLPVEAYLVLPADYTVDDVTGACAGSGPLAGIGAGSVVRVEDESVSRTADQAPTITLPAGEEVSREDPRSSFLLSFGESAACAFTLPDLGYDIAEYDGISLSPATGPNINSTVAPIGQRVIFTFENSP